MSYSESKKKYGNLKPASGVRDFEKLYLENPLRISIDEDFAVELLVDEIRECFCYFAFKDSLKNNFHEAKERAVNCLELGDVVPRRVHNWVEDCLKCVDVLILVYLVDVLKVKVSGKGDSAKERDVYSFCEQLSDEQMAVLAEKMHSVYQTRSHLLHRQVVENDGQRVIEKLSNKQRLSAYEFAKGCIREALNVLVPKYRSAFPEHCTNEGQQ